MNIMITGDSSKFDGKELQAYEGQVFTLKCEVPETNPVSSVTASIDGKELRLTRYEKQPLDNQLTLNAYYFDVNATRAMNGKKIKCDARMRDLAPDLVNTLDMRTHIVKEYPVTVYCKLLNISNKYKKIQEK